jgi:hypothetical protein
MHYVRLPLIKRLRNSMFTKQFQSYTDATGGEAAGLHTLSSMVCGCLVFLDQQANERPARCERLHVDGL